MQDLSYRITHQSEPNEQAVIAFGVDTAAQDVAGAVREPLNVYVYALQSVIGGVTGYTIGTNLVIKALWVDNAFRSRGVARRLMDMIAVEAQGKGCKTVLIDIMSYQPVDFFARIGYAEQTRLDAFQDDHARIFMQKTL